MKFCFSLCTSRCNWFDVYDEVATAVEILEEDKIETWFSSTEEKEEISSVNQQMVIT